MNRSNELSEDVSESDTAFFSTLTSTLQACSSHVRSEVMVHVDYLAHKAGVTRDSLLSGQRFRVIRPILMDAKKNINAVLGRGPVSAGAGTASIDDMVALAERTLEGWCSREKAMAIAKLVTEEKPQICVEIGIYGGRSLVPAAAALKQNGSGAIYGIETWRPDVATEHVTNDVNDAWWRNIDFQGIKSTFYRFIAEQGLAAQVRVIEAPSADVAALFPSIDYLHIDGAHSIYNAAEDVVLYAKRVKKGGIIIMDDTNWPTTAPAVAILDSLGDRIQSFNDENGHVACVIFRKR